MDPTQFFRRVRQSITFDAVHVPPCSTGFIIIIIIIHSPHHSISTLQDFASLDPYTPVTSLEVLAAEIGLPVEQLVKLDANENLYGPIEEVRCRCLAMWLHSLRHGL